MVGLMDLSARLQRSVPQRNNIPADYDQLVMDAVNQLGNDLPIITSWQFTTTAGVASYDLPSDFLSLIELNLPVSSGGVLITNDGLVPVSEQWTQGYYIEGMTIRFDPAPRSSTTQVMRYAATYALNDQQVFPRLSENGARIALLYAQYLALMEQANTAQHNAWSYKIGDESVDKSKQGSGLMAQAGEVLKLYSTAIKPLQGYGSRYKSKANPDDY